MLQMLQNCNSTLLYAIIKQNYDLWSNWLKQTWQTDIKKDTPNNFLWKVILKTRCGSRNFIFHQNFFPWLSMTPCLKGTFFLDFPNRMNPVWPKTKEIRKYWKNFKNGWKQGLAPCLPYRTKYLVTVVKNCTK